MKLDAIRTYALSLPEAVEQPHFEFTSFRIRGKVFATAPPDGAFIHIFVDEDLRAPLIATDPATFSPLYWGERVVGLRVQLPADAATLTRLLRESWKRKAPKKLAAGFE